MKRFILLAMVTLLVVVLKGEEDVVEAPPKKSKEKEARTTIAINSQATVPKGRVEVRAARPTVKAYRGQFKSKPVSKKKRSAQPQPAPKAKAKANVQTYSYKIKVRKPEVKRIALRHKKDRKEKRTTRYVLDSHGLKQKRPLKESTLTVKFKQPKQPKQPKLAKPFKGETQLVKPHKYRRVIHIRGPRIEKREKRQVRVWPKKVTTKPKALATPPVKISVKASMPPLVLHKMMRNNMQIKIFKRKLKHILISLQKAPAARKPLLQQQIAILRGAINTVLKKQAALERQYGKIAWGQVGVAAHGNVRLRLAREKAQDTKQKVQKLTLKLKLVHKKIKGLSKAMKQMPPAQRVVAVKKIKKLQAKEKHVVKKLRTAALKHKKAKQIAHKFKIRFTSLKPKIKVTKPPRVVAPKPISKIRVKMGTRKGGLKMARRQPTKVQWLRITRKKVMRQVKKLYLKQKKLKVNLAQINAARSKAPLAEKKKLGKQEAKLEDALLQLQVLTYKKMCEAKRLSKQLRRAVKHIAKTAVAKAKTMKRMAAKLKAKLADTATKLRQLQVALKQAVPGQKPQLQRKLKVAKAQLILVKEQWRKVHKVHHKAGVWAFKAKKTARKMARKLAKDQCDFLAAKLKVLSKQLIFLTQELKQDCFQAGQQIPTTIEKAAAGLRSGLKIVKTNIKRLRQILAVHLDKTLCIGKKVSCQKLQAALKTVSKKIASLKLAIKAITNSFRGPGTGPMKAHIRLMKQSLFKLQKTARALKAVLRTKCASKKKVKLIIKQKKILQSLLKDAAPAEKKAIARRILKLNLTFKKQPTKVPIQKQRLKVASPQVVSKPKAKTAASKPRAPSKLKLKLKLKLKGKPQTKPKLQPAPKPKFTKPQKKIAKIKKAVKELKKVAVNVPSTEKAQLQLSISALKKKIKLLKQHELEKAQLKTKIARLKKTIAELRGVLARMPNSEKSKLQETIKGMNKNLKVLKLKLKLKLKHKHKGGAKLKITPKKPVTKLKGKAKTPAQKKIEKKLKALITALKIVPPETKAILTKKIKKLNKALKAQTLKKEQKTKVTLLLSCAIFRSQLSPKNTVCLTANVVNKKINKKIAALKAVIKLVPAKAQKAIQKKILQLTHKKAAKTSPKRLLSRKTKLEKQKEIATKTVEKLKKKIVKLKVQATKLSSASKVNVLKKIKLLETVKKNVEKKLNKLASKKPKKHTRTKCKMLERKLAATLKKAKILEKLYEKECKWALQSSPALKQKAQNLRRVLQRTKEKAKLLRLIKGTPSPRKSKANIKLKCRKLSQELVESVKAVVALQAQFQRECLSSSKPAPLAAKIGAKLHGAVAEARQHVKSIKKLMLRPKRAQKLSVIRQKQQSINRRISVLQKVLKHAQPKLQGKIVRALSQLQKNLVRLNVKATQLKVQRQVAHTLPSPALRPRIAKKPTGKLVRREKRFYVKTAKAKKEIAKMGKKLQLLLKTLAKTPPAQRKPLERKVLQQRRKMKLMKAKLAGHEKKGTKLYTKMKKLPTDKINECAKNIQELAITLKTVAALKRELKKECQSAKLSPHPASLSFILLHKSCFKFRVSKRMISSCSRH